MHSPFANFTLLQPTSIMAFVVDFFHTSFEFGWILMLVQRNLDLGTLDLVTVIDVVAILQDNFSIFYI